MKIGKSLDQIDPAVIPAGGPPLAVMLVCLSIRHGGVDVRVAQTALGLQSLGISYTVVTIADSILHRSLVAQGIDCTPLARGRLDPRIVIDLIRLAAAKNILVIDAHNSQSQLWAALAAWFGGIKGRIATTHSVYREDHPGYLRQLAHESTLSLCRWRGFHFIAVSRSVEIYLQQQMNVPHGRITLSRNGIAPMASPPTPCDLRAEAGWPPEAVICAMIGRLDLRKGHRLAILALRDCVARGEVRPRLFIAGTGREDEALRALVSECGLDGYVHFAGFRSDVSAILEDVDLFLLPSFSEGLPYAVLEAARQGVPTLSSRLEGTEDCFVDERTIFFTPVGDLPAFTDRLITLTRSEDLRKSVGVAARQMVETEMPVTRMVADTVEIYARQANRCTAGSM